MRLSISYQVTRAQARQKAGHDQSSKDRQVKLGDLMRNIAAGLTWVAGSITAAESGPRSFVVELSDGRVVKRHLGHVRSKTVAHSQDITNEHNIDDIQWPFLPAAAEPVGEDGSSSSQMTTPRRSTRQQGSP